MPTKTKTSTAKKKPAAKKKESGNPCWDGYEPTPGKAPGAKGSCKKKGT